MLNVFDEVVVGEKCLIGACAYVKYNLLSFSVIKTANDNFIIKQYSEDVIETKWMAHSNVR